MGPDLRIDWDVVGANPDDYEKLVKLLLQRLYPDGEVIDGRGGDGGREFRSALRTRSSSTRRSRLPAGCPAGIRTAAARSKTR